jgi:hypothetical protein
MGHNDTVLGSRYRDRQSFYGRPFERQTPLPTDEYPLFAHATKRWAETIGGKFFYFGPWHDPRAALKTYQQFMAGIPRRKPRRVAAAGRLEKPRTDFFRFAHATGR